MRAVNVGVRGYGNAIGGLKPTLLLRRADDHRHERIGG
jgi:hypothetical protein